MLYQFIWTALPEMRFSEFRTDAEAEVWVSQLWGNHTARGPGIKAATEGRHCKPTLPMWLLRGMKRWRRLQINKLKWPQWAFGTDELFCCVLEAGPGVQRVEKTLSYWVSKLGQNSTLQNWITHVIAINTFNRRAVNSIEITLRFATWCDEFSTSGTWVKTRLICAGKVEENMKQTPPKCT